MSRNKNPTEETQALYLLSASFLPELSPKLVLPNLI